MSGPIAAGSGRALRPRRTTAATSSSLLAVIVSGVLVPSCWRRSQRREPGDLLSAGENLVDAKEVAKLVSLLRRNAVPTDQRRNPTMPPTIIDLGPSHSTLRLPQRALFGSTFERER